MRLHSENSNFQNSKNDKKTSESNLETLRTGLSQEEAQKRLKENGYNEVTEKKPNLAVGFIKKFWGLTAWMLEIIIIISFVLQALFRHVHCCGSACF